MAGDRIAVTGAAGFIGSALVRGLIAREDGEVHVIDNLLSGSKQNLKEVWSKMALYVADIRNYDEIYLWMSCYFFRSTDRNSGKVCVHDIRSARPYDR